MTVKQLEDTQKKEINSPTEELNQYKDELAKLQTELEKEKSKSWWDKLKGKQKNKLKICYNFKCCYNQISDGREEVKLCQNFTL